MQPIFIADRENVDPVTGESSVHHHKPQASTSGSVQPLQPKQQGTQPVQPSNSRQPLADVTHFFVQQVRHFNSALGRFRCQLFLVPSPDSGSAERRG